MTTRLHRRLLAAATLVSLAGSACKQAAPPEPPPEQASTPPAIRSTSAALRGPIVSIDVTGTSRSDAMRAALASTVGATYDPASLARDVRALWRLRGLADVQVDARAVDGGVAVRYRVRELPRIRKFELEGGPVLYTSGWRIRLADINDAVQDPAQLEQLAEDMRAELVGHAYLDAKIVWRFVEADEGRVDVVFTVREGPQVKLAALTVRGNKKLTTAELTTLFRSNGVAVGQPFARTAHDAAQLGVLARYQDLGHLDAAFGEFTEVRSADGASISATYELREGEALRLGKITVTGALVAPVGEYLQRLGVAKGQPFNRSKLVQGLEKIRTLQRERGGSPNVTPLTEVDRKKKQVDLSIEISSQ